jgi:V/A-type H+-transporting ATPase subunit C
VVGYLYRDRIRCDIPIDSILNAETFSEVTAAVSKTPYFDIFQAAEDKVEDLRSIFPVEVGLDRYFYSQLLTEVDRFRGKDREVASRMIGVEIDMQNLNWIIRFKSTFGLNPDEAIGYLMPRGLRLHNDVMTDAYAAGNDTEMLSMLQGTGYGTLDTVLTAGSGDASSRLLMMESFLAQIIMQEARRILIGNPFTVGTLLAYFLLKNTEMRNIMTLLNGKNYNLSEERIRSALLF